MTSMLPHDEHHFIHRVGWLRAAVLGANDGIVSTASLIVGVAAATPDKSEVLIAGVAALFAGAMSMAAGEYVSVSSQADTEKADLETERKALASNPEGELQELTHIYMERGLDEKLAREVARQLTDHDALAAHARDELGIHEAACAQPIQAALVSAITFSAGSSLPLLALVLAPSAQVILAVSIMSLLSLALLGVLSARAGGANPLTASLRVLWWGVMALLVTAGIGKLFGIVMG